MAKKGRRSTYEERLAAARMLEQKVAVDRVAAAVQMVTVPTGTTNINPNEPTGPASSPSPANQAVLILSGNQHRSDRAHAPVRRIGHRRGSGACPSEGCGSLGARAGCDLHARV